MAKDSTVPGSITTNGNNRASRMISAGTCSWAEKSLIQSGEFYPKGDQSAEDRIRYYASHFNTVEVDSSYYAIPGRSNSALWAERTPAAFIFHLKAYGALTGHGVDPGTLPGEILRHLPRGEKESSRIYIKDPSILRAIAERFIDALTPLAEAGKLGLAVFQFPQWFHYRPANLDHILFCKTLMEGLLIGVEFRHGSWLGGKQAGEVISFLRENGIAYITADEPQYGNLATIPFLPAVTADVAYFRFHGRNRQNWLRRGIETSLRYDYLYSDDELREFLQPILAASKTAKVTCAMFNNCHGASAVKNALRMKEMIEKETGMGG